MSIPGRELATEIPGAVAAHPPARRASRPVLHLTLLVATVLTTLIAGSIFHSDNDPRAWRAILGAPVRWLDGAPYSISVLAILLAHELGHYVACGVYRIQASLPYFLPGIPILGTFGAFIRIRDRITNRKALFDIGIAGPLAGFIVAVPIFLHGMSRSKMVPLASLTDSDFYLGFPLLFSLAAPFFFPTIPPGSALSLSPYLSAAWVGMLATSLNLLPAGQLDGGHICYAISRRFHATMSRLTLIAVILMGLLSRAWVVWAVILLLLGDRHPVLLDETTGLSPARRVLAVVALAILLLSFMPVPIQTSF